MGREREAGYTKNVGNSFFFSLEGEGGGRKGRRKGALSLPNPPPLSPPPSSLSPTPTQANFFVGFSAGILFSEPAVFAGPERMDVLKIITWAVEEPVSNLTLVIERALTSRNGLQT